MTTRTRREAVARRSAARPPDEARRLATLYELDLLDTSPQEQFDRIARMACRIYGTPIAAISFIDVDREWFKSRVGLAATEFPRACAMTGHVVLHDDILVVPDASSDLRFFDHPLVRQHPGVRFYAGAPIRATNDATLGALSIMAFEPRSLESDEHELLRELAASVEHEIGTSSLGLVDPLTGFFNQKGLRLVADHVLRRSNRYGEAVSMLIINLEDLDAINLEAGRGAGDAALVQIAEILRDTVRSADVPARMRADDFAVILPDTDEEGAALLAARIRRGLLGRQRRISSDFPSAVQIARGTVYPTEDDFTLKDLINLTDIAG